MGARGGLIHQSLAKRQDGLDVADQQAEILLPAVLLEPAAETGVWLAALCFIRRGQAGGLLVRRVFQG
jgi:hypothetical protein